MKKACYLPILKIMLCSSVVLSREIHSSGENSPGRINRTDINLTVKNNYAGILTLQSKDPSCISFFTPDIGYSYNNALKHGATVGLRFVNAMDNCECGAFFGGLCYLVGSSYGMQGTWFPATQTADVTANASFRYLYMCAEINGGYSVSTNPASPGNFFHLGPFIGVDLVIAKLTIGYSFRTQRINNHFGSFAGSLTFYPFSFNGNKSYKSYFR